MDLTRILQRIIFAEYKIVKPMKIIASSCIVPVIKAALPAVAALAAGQIAAWRIVDGVRFQCILIVGKICAAYAAVLHRLPISLRFGRWMHICRRYFDMSDIRIKRNMQVFSAKSVARLDKILNFAKCMPIKCVRLKNLCTRTDTDVQGVESGSSILIMMNNECLSGFTSRIVAWIPLSCFLHYRVLPEPYSREMWTRIHVTLQSIESARCATYYKPFNCTPI